mmetsp:Transcript_14596/g.41056  ORF Transcript_14596/g.41056 Transcript_14596/m.41056 type:complete len:347 (+) Transcript_14596:148-1188(+)|eukprot:CAMPEP_0117667856 /NCGR_PEP_ID=MMETSP0804-20121206/11208_1 /TAXON_ID=1074897 /ORGANISM="Tetraselmis astigmatica, Strain CCMP880" /LENGTH=346 /DNA_ID=CAMNT_0005475647 /DNA_START=92 /DNA_END=1132 /DNA_ORIENTATION=+
MPAQGNVGIAWAVVIGAASATVLGSALVFLPDRWITGKFLALSLGLSAGVMLFVSFVDIYMGKAVADLEAHLEESAENAAGLAFIFSTLCFFAGTVFVAVMDSMSNLLLAQAFKGKPGKPSASNPIAIKDILRGEENSAKDIEKTKEGAAAICAMPDVESLRDGVDDGDDGLQQLAVPLPDHLKPIMAVAAEHCGDLKRLGLMAGAAIAIHNFPEGIATFVAGLTDSPTGISLGVGIALHNIPEGICVAVPLYYATGSKMYAFGLSSLFALSEVAGGLLAYLILWNAMSSLASGIMFAAVGGIMVYVVMVDVYPVALKFDERQTVVTPAFFAGMFIMATSLMLFSM